MTASLLLAQGTRVHGHKRAFTSSTPLFTPSFLAAAAADAILLPVSPSTTDDPLGTTPHSFIPTTAANLSHCCLRTSTADDDTILCARRGRATD